MADFTHESDEPIDQAPAGTVPTHPKDCRPGRNDVVVSTMHYGLKRMTFEKDIPVRMRDGTTLFVNIFRPPYDGKFPVVVSFDFYGKDSIHKDTAAAGEGPYTLGQHDASQFAAWEAPDPGFWVPNGYVVVKAASRGTSGAAGRISPMSLTEAEDFYDIIEWCGTQPWSDGKVVTNGVSYLAMTQWRVGQLNPPHLTAMVVWEGVSDLYREWAFHGGIPETGFSRFIDDLVKKTWPGCELDEMDTGRREHPFLDDYWQGLHGNLADIKVPLYVCASWSTHGTHTRGTIEGFRQASSKYKWLEVHGRKEWETYYARDVLERQLRFCNFFLKGEENDWLDTPRVRYEARDRFYDGPTKFSDVWPLRETHYKELYLDGEGSVLKDQPIQAPREVAYDPMAPNTDAGRAVFTYKFDVDTELSGYFKLKLWVEADGADDMDLFIGLRKLDRRGRELHFPDFNHVENGIMAHGWLRVSHRELDPERTTVYQPWLKHQRELKLKPGEIVPVEIEIWPSSTLFHAGEALRLEVQGGQLTYTRSSPLPRQHGRVGSSHDELVNAGRHIIHCGGEFDSHLLVPTIPSSR